MELFTLLASILCFIVFLSTLYHFFMKVRFNRHLGIDLTVILIGLAYLVLAVILFLSSKGILELNQKDFLTAYSIVLVLQTVSILTIVYFSNKNPRIFYSLLSFLAIIPFLVISMEYLYLLAPICFLIMLLSFLTFSNSHKISTTYLIIYCSLSLITYVILILWKNGAIKLFLPSLIIFNVFLYYFLEQIRDYNRPFLPSIDQRENHIIHYLKHFIFIIIITNFVFIGTIGVHEIGHLFMASAFTQCSGNKIVYEMNGFPHTEVTCKDQSDKSLWIMAGILLPLILSALLFFGGGISIKEIALEIVGFNLAISYIDFMDLGLSKALSSFLMISGIALGALSLALLARSRTQ